jgi:hypothetical protein
MLTSLLVASAAFSGPAARVSAAQSPAVGSAPARRARRALARSLALTRASFPTPCVRGRGAQPIASRSAVRMEMSPSVPFLEKAAKLGKGMSGDVGFDPLYLSESMDLKWLRESELKHGRVCMLGVVGLIVPSFIRLGGPYYDSANPIEAASKVPVEAWAQILLTIGLIEFFSNAGKMTMDDMFSDSSRVPGKLGFDPLKMGGSSEMELKELKNGRLAMLAFGGMLHQVFITGKPVLDGFSS